jgi:hypothetical protein
MKKYRFYLPKWADEVTAKVYRTILKDWIAENDGVATPLFVKDDIYVYATDKDVLHMVITSHDFDDLPKVLTNYGSDILDVLVDAVDARDVDDDYDPEEELYEYLVD